MNGVPVSSAEINQGGGVLSGLPAWFVQTLQSLKGWLSGQGGTGATQVWGGTVQAVNSQTAGKVVLLPHRNPHPVVKIVTRTPGVPASTEATTTRSTTTRTLTAHHRQAKVATPPMNRAWHAFVSPKPRR